MHSIDYFSRINKAVVTRHHVTQQQFTIYITEVTAYHSSMKNFFFVLHLVLFTSTAFAQAAREQHGRKIHWDQGYNLTCQVLESGSEIRLTKGWDGTKQNGDEVKLRWIDKSEHEVCLQKTAQLQETTKSSQVTFCNGDNLTYPGPRQIEELLTHAHMSVKFSGLVSWHGQVYSTACQLSLTQGEPTEGGVSGGNR